MTTSESGMSNEVDSDFVLRLPKVELHAHLNGSISRECLQSIWEHKSADGLTLLESPMLAMPPGKFDFDIKTFFPLFSEYIYELCNDLESIRKSTLSVLQDFMDDGVIYLELRTTPRAIPETGISKEQYIETVLACMEEFGSNRHDSNAAKTQMITRLILSIDRKNTAHQAMETVQLATKYQSRGIVGVDLCGNPAKGDVSIYRDAFEMAKRSGLGITVHFAEIPASATHEELTTLLSFGPDRLGHVIHVNEEIKREIAKRKLGLELCLSCNVLAKLTEGGFAEHHFGVWRDTECPISLSTDDVGVFGSKLSNEYLLAARHFGLNRREIVLLAAQSVQCIFSGKDKCALRDVHRDFLAKLE